MKLRTGLVSVMSCGMRIPPEPQTVTAMSMVPPRRHASDPRRRSSDTTPSLHAWLMQFASVTPADAHDFPSEHPPQNSPPIASPPQSMSVSGAVLDAIVATRRGTEIEDTIQGHAEPTRLGPTSANTSITIGTRMGATLLDQNERFGGVALPSARATASLGPPGDPIGAEAASDSRRLVACPAAIARDGPACSAAARWRPSPHPGTVRSSRG